MADRKPDESASSRPPETPILGCFLSAFRILVGPGLLFVVGAIMIVNKPKLGSVWDFIFLGVLISTLAAAILAPSKPVTAPLSPGEVAPMSRSKYVALLVGVSIAVFLFAHFIAPKVF